MPSSRSVTQLIVLQAETLNPSRAKQGPGESCVFIFCCNLVTSTPILPSRCDRHDRSDRRPHASFWRVVRPRNRAPFSSSSRRRCGGRSTRGMMGPIIAQTPWWATGEKMGVVSVSLDQGSSARPRSIQLSSSRGDPREWADGCSRPPGAWTGQQTGRAIAAPRRLPCRVQA